MPRSDRNRIFAQLITKVTTDAVLSVKGVSSVGKRGVSFTRDKTGGQLLIDVFLNVSGGCKIPEAAWRIQDTVKKRVEAETDSAVGKVNIHIQGVDYKTENSDAKI